MIRRLIYLNPWWVVVGSTLALVVCNGPVGLFTFGVFLKPITEEFGWDRSTMSAASGMASLMIAVGVPVTGMLVDRWGVLRVLLPVILLFSVPTCPFRAMKRHAKSRCYSIARRELIYA